MIYQAMKLHGGALNATSKKSHSEELLTIWFHLYEILEKAKYGNSKKMSGCQGLGSKRGRDE